MSAEEVEKAAAEQLGKRDAETRAAVEAADKRARMEEVCDIEHVFDKRPALGRIRVLPMRRISFLLLWVVVSLFVLQRVKMTLEFSQPKSAASPSYRNLAIALARDRVPSAMVEGTYPRFLVEVAAGEIEELRKFASSKNATVVEADEPIVADEFATTVAGVFTEAQLQEELHRANPKLTRLVIRQKYGKVEDISVNAYKVVRCEMFGEWDSLDEQFSRGLSVPEVGRGAGRGTGDLHRGRF
ncbi:hypothetical protein PAPYR_12136 [Paratrimastix pyriformis]|uniref:Uncharacterized protein n=1 Tax=Paratrimastix pyriformis TaxID=342808 RepID=A0ABQ8U624_9EUKA|nr:hypothetical protein PAPYR_12136 [Paratrimastix pyriformis]